MRQDEVPPPDRGGAAENGGGEAVSILERRLGVALGDRATALAAITHKSYVNEHRDEPGLADNERLEFLGDAVIDLAVSHRLMERFPAAREGDLSKMRAAVVDERGLSEMARALDLGALLRLGRGEELTGGRRKASLLADAMEAVVAAVYLDAGLAPVLTLIDRFLGEAFRRAVAGTLDRDFKTQLQELSQSRLRATPRYRVVREHGPDHSKTFEVETDLRGEVLGRGEGRSKKDAEQAAAKLALDRLGRRFAQESSAAPAAAATAAHEELAAPAIAPAPEDAQKGNRAETAGAAPAAEGAPTVQPAPGAEAAPAEEAARPPAPRESSAEPARAPRTRKTRPRARTAAPARKAGGARPRAGSTKAPAPKRARKGTKAKR